MNFLNHERRSTDKCNTQAARDPDEEGDYLAFEQLMAEAATKKNKDDKKKKHKHSKSPESPGEEKPAEAA